MDSYTSAKNSKNIEAFGINQNEMVPAYDRDFNNFIGEITIHDPEKYQYDGQAFEEEIICKSYDPHLDDFMEIHGVAYNINKKGLVFKTDQSLEVGDPIFIKSKLLFGEEHYNELVEGVHAKVIWCNRTFNQNHNLCYEVGVEYFS